MEPYYPHLSSIGPAPSANEIYATYRRAFAQQVSDGIRRPVVFPDHFWTIILLVIYLCIPHKEHPRIYALRWPLVGFITWFEFCKIWDRSSVGVGLGLQASLISAFYIVLAWTWLVFLRPQWDAKRVQRVKLQKNFDVDDQSEPIKPLIKKGSLRQRKFIDGQTENFGEDEIDKETYRYFWQSYPENLKDRIPWVLDLIFNMRGPGWNWAISSIPSLPPEILKKAGERVPEVAYLNVLPVGIQRFNTRRELLLYHLSRYIFSLILLDAIKVIMMKDPYFKFGPTSYELPSYLESLSPFMLQFYRLAVTAVAIIISVIANYSLPALIISCLGGSHIFGLRAEPWYYPSIWGSFSRVLEKGLDGFWADFWHQSFRFYFTAPYVYLLRKGYISPGSSAAKIVSLVIAFGISGLLHGAASISAFSATYPSHMMSFFLLQGLGIAVQRAYCSILSTYIKRLPNSIRYAGNLLFTFTWLFYTGWLNADDLARGGLWISEPVPFSFLHFLGFGESDTEFRRWKNLGFEWHAGKHWWQSGYIVI